MQSKRHHERSLWARLGDKTFSFSLLFNCITAAALNPLCKIFWVVRNVSIRCCIRPLVHRSIGPYARDEFLFNQLKMRLNKEPERIDVEMVLRRVENRCPTTYGLVFAPPLFFSSQFNRDLTSLSLEDVMQKSFLQFLFLTLSYFISLYFSSPHLISPHLCSSHVILPYLTVWGSQRIISTVLLVTWSSHLTPCMF